MKCEFTMNVLVARDLIDLLTSTDDIGMNELATVVDECQGAVHSGEDETSTLVVTIIE